MTRADAEQDAREIAWTYGVGGGTCADLAHDEPCVFCAFVQDTATALLQSHNRAVEAAAEVARAVAVDHRDQCNAAEHEDIRTEHARRGRTALYIYETIRALGGDA